MSDLHFGAIHLVLNNDGTHKWNRTPPATTFTQPSAFYDSTTKAIILSSEVKLEEISVEIIDKDKNVLLQESVTIEPDKTAVINIDNLSSGIYNIRIWMGGYSYIGTFEIES